MFASCLGFFCRGNVDAASVAVEEHVAVHKGEDGVVAAHAHAVAGGELGAELAHENVAGQDLLAAEALDAAPLTGAGFNPAREAAPRLFTFLSGWGRVALAGDGAGGFFVYWLGPIVGAMIAAYGFRRALRLRTI